MLQLVGDWLIGRRETWHNHFLLHLLSTCTDKITYISIKSKNITKSALWQKYRGNSSGRRTLDTKKHLGKTKLSMTDVWGGEGGFYWRFWVFFMRFVGLTLDLTEKHRCACDYSSSLFPPLHCWISLNLQRFYMGQKLRPKPSLFPTQMNPKLDNSKPEMILWLLF